MKLYHWIWEVYHSLQKEIKRSKGDYQDKKFMHHDSRQHYHREKLKQYKG